MSLSYLLIPLIIITLSLLAFYPTFNLSLFGDDWMTFWRYLQYLGPSSSRQWNHISYFLTSYGPQDIIMGLLQKVYGFNSFNYQLTSYILRLIASFSLYPVAWYLTKNKLAAFFAVTFFSITAIGLETTDWVFNMPSYIAIIFLNLFFYFYLRLTKEQNVRLLIPTGIFFFAAILSQPIRMHGVLPFILMMELFWLWQNYSYGKLKQMLIRLGCLLSLFLFILLVLSNSPVVTGGGLFTDGVRAISELINKGTTNFLLNPIITIGSLFVPSITSTQPFLLLLGTSILIVWFLLLIKFRKNKEAKTALLFSFGWLILSYLIAWFRSPQSILFTTHRYLIVSAVGVSLFFATIISLGKNYKSRVILSSLVTLMILFNIISTHKYLQNKLLSHSRDITDKIWTQMPYIKEVGKDNKPLVFYFEGDSTNVDILHDVITFGFPPHMALLYGITEENRTPIPMSDFREVVSAVTDGKSFAPYSHPLKAIAVDRVYAFQLQGKDNLINITDIAREKLRQLK